jgi:DNA-binding Lrp family transcriptional regulator
MLIECLSKRFDVWRKFRLETSLIERMDEIDTQIINLLQENSRLSFNKVAHKLGISVGNAVNRVKNLEDRGILRGYTVIVDSNKAGYSQTVIVLGQAEGKHLSDVEKEIAKMDNAISVYDITGDFDFAVIARFKDKDSLNAFIKRLLATPNVKRTVTHVALNVIKEDFRVKLR